MAFKLCNTSCPVNISSFEVVLEVVYPSTQYARFKSTTNMTVDTTAFNTLSGTCVKSDQSSTVSRNFYFINPATDETIQEIDMRDGNNIDFSIDVSALSSVKIRMVENIYTTETSTPSTGIENLALHN